MNKATDVPADTYFRSINHFIYFAWNYPQNFFDAFDEQKRDYLKEKFSELYEKYGCAAVMFRFYQYLDSNNRLRLVEWAQKHYSGNDF